MKANELRIGNWCASPYEPKIFKVSAMHILHLEEGMDSLSILGIPLTPEILQKAGFAVAFTSDPQSPNASKKYTLGLFKIHQPDEDAPFLYFFSEDYDVRLKYLHQLQNLYFALTGEELNIQL
jgi:hypothetical protein